MKRHPILFAVVAIVALSASSQASGDFALGCARDGSTNDAAVPRPVAREGLSAKELEARGFVAIPAGTFLMGSPETEIDRRDEEGPQHSVTVSAFYMGKYEVTQSEWIAVMGSNPSYDHGDELPVERVTWYEAIEFCNRKSLRDGLTPCYSGAGDAVVCDFAANGYRLPTEAEWEYACRAGTATAYHVGDTIEANRANYAYAIGATTPVGSYAPNPWGLYDMHGNVWEQCWDWYEPDYYAKSPEKDPAGPSKGSWRVIRGGGWDDDAWLLRSATRNAGSRGDRDDDAGFRVVCRP